jgi:arylsulfatase A
VANPDYEISQSNMFQERWIPRVKNGGYKDFQLFDLSNDPGQTQNIAYDNPELLKQLKAKLLKINQSIMADGVDWHLQ